MSDDEYEYEYDDYEYEDSSDMEEDNCMMGTTSESTAVREFHSVENNPTKFGGTIGGGDNANPQQGGSTTALLVTQRPPLVSMMKVEALLPEVNRRIKEAAEALAVPTEAAAPLLRGYKWSEQSLLQNYYNNPDSILKQFGVYHRVRTFQDQTTINACSASAGGKSIGDCPICLDSLVDSDTKKMAMPCGHEFCLDCWNDYLVNKIQEEGATCVLATCPQAGCSEVLTEVEVKVAAPELLPKFENFQLRNFIESNDLTRWCPGAGCDFIAYCSSSQTFLESNRDYNFAHCHGCNTKFCLSCGDEPHVPIRCKELVKWNDKNMNESETANWITANTKTCPKCSSRIEKNGGCMHVQCRKCKHGFCWVCLGSHHVWQCNAYKPDEDKDRAKNELERYLHYYNRYHAHSQAQTFAQQQLDELMEQDKSNAFLEDNKQNDETASNTNNSGAGSTTDAADNAIIIFGFLIDANQQLVKCRRVLKYSYAFAYYQFVDSTMKKHKECFEHHQGILEGLTEALSELTEKPKTTVDINQADIINRTRVIGQFIKNVLDYVDNGMD